MKTPAVQRAAGRKKLASTGDALPDGSFPIPDVAYLKKAIKSVGRAPAAKRPALKRLIVKRARELKATSAPGVKGTWPFEGAGDTKKAVDLAMNRKMPMVNGMNDVVVHPTGNVTHKSTGMKIGTVAKSGSGFVATHVSGAKTPELPSPQAAVNGLITMHNNLAAGKAGGGIASVKGYAGGGDAVTLATPAASASDGPRVTTQAGSAPAAAVTSMSAEVQKIYKKLIAKGLKPGQAMALAKRAAGMHAKAAAKTAA